MNDLEMEMRKKILSKENDTQMYIKRYVSLHDSGVKEDELLQKINNNQGFINGVLWVLDLLLEKIE